MGLSMEEGCGIYRTPELMQKTVDKLAELQERFKRVRITDTSSVFNTDLLYTIELGHGLNVAECMAHSARRVKSPAARTSVWMRAALNVTTSISLNTLSPARCGWHHPSGLQRRENHHAATGETRVRCRSRSRR